MFSVPGQCGKELKVSKKAGGSAFLFLDSCTRFSRVKKNDARKTLALLNSKSRTVKIPGKPPCTTGENGLSWGPRQEMGAGH